MKQPLDRSRKTSRIKAKHQQVADVEAEMLRRVRARGGISRVELAREMRLAPSTVGIYADRLLREGFLLEAETPGRETAGRPPTSLLLNPDGGRFIGVDLEARSLMTTLVDFSQQPLRQAHTAIRPSDSAAKILAKIEEAIDETVAGDARPVLGIGLGVPGTIDPVAGLAIRYELIRGWSDIPLGPRLAQRYGVPVFLENNIRSLAMAEMWFGGGRGLRNFVCVGIRSGIAAGVVAGRRLIHGSQHRAGEIGHWVCPVPTGFADEHLSERDPSWSWPMEARLERVASVPAVLAAAQRGMEQGETTSLDSTRGELTIDDVAAAVRGGDAFALSLVRAVGRVHGWVAHQLNELFDPEKIIFAGPLADLGEPFLVTIRETARQLDSTGREPVIAQSTLGRYGGAVGAAALALDQWRPKR